MPLELQPPRSGKTPFWYVRGTVRGRSIFASTKARDKKTAERFKEQLELDLAKQDANKHSPTTFRMAAQMYSTYRNPKPRDQKAIDRLVALIGDYELSDIRQTVLVDAANELYGSAAPATKNREAMVPASAILHYAAENNICPYIRVKKFKEKTPEPRALNKSHAKTLMGSAEGPLRFVLVFLFRQGWRVSDVLKATWGDVELKEKTIRYHIRKTDEWRVMPLHEEVVRLMNETPEKSRVGRLFHWGNKSNLYRELRPFCKKLRIKFTPHMARHSFATWLANEGVSPLEIMEAGGWKDTKSVQRYAKLDPTRVRSVINKI